MAEQTKIPSFEQFSFQDVARDTNTFRQPSAEELKIFLERHPHVKISCDASDLNSKDPEQFPPQLDAEENPMEAASQFGWHMRYDSAVGSDKATAEITMPQALFPADSILDEDTDEELSLPTMQNQSFFSALELIDFCASHGWTKIHIERGTDICRFSVWAACRVLEIPCTGFDASGYDEIRFTNSKSNVEYVLNAYKDQLDQTLSPSPGSASESSAPQTDDTPEE